MVMKSIIWKKGIFSSTHELFSNGMLIGKLQSKTWSSDAISTINGKHFSFKTRGFLSQSTILIDNDINKVVGKITYSDWRKRASIELQDTTAELKVDNIWNSRWTLKDKNNHSILYKDSTTMGTIQFANQNDKLIIAGLYARNHFKQKSTVLLIAIFLPIYLALLTQITH
jgi:hypothetical protein